MEASRAFDLQKFNDKSREFVPVVRLTDLERDSWFHIDNARIVKTRFGFRILLKLYEVIDSQQSYFECYLPERYLSTLNETNIDHFNSEEYIMKCINKHDGSPFIILERASNIRKLYKP